MLPRLAILVGGFGFIETVHRFRTHNGAVVAFVIGTIVVLASLNELRLAKKR